MLHEDDFEYWERFNLRVIDLKNIELIVLVEW